MTEADRPTPSETAAKVVTKHALGIAARTIEGVASGKPVGEALKEGIKGHVAQTAGEGAHRVVHGDGTKGWRRVLAHGARGVASAATQELARAAETAISKRRPS